MWAHGIIRNQMHMLATLKPYKDVNDHRSRIDTASECLSTKDLDNDHRSYISAESQSIAENKNITPNATNAIDSVDCNVFHNSHHFVLKPEVRSSLQQPPGHPTPACVCNKARQDGSSDDAVRFRA